MRTHRMETLACKWDGRRNLRCSPDGTLSYRSALSEVAELDGAFSVTRRIRYSSTEHFMGDGHQRCTVSLIIALRKRIRRETLNFTSLVATGFVGKPLVAWESHPVFRIDSQSVSDSVDVVEVADHLRGDCDLVVVEALRAQIVDIGFLYRPGAESQFDGEVAKLSIRLG